MHLYRSGNPTGMDQPDCYFVAHFSENAAPELAIEMDNPEIWLMRHISTKWL
jgi:hypothetical protein